jgi:putative sterol carrier protein
VIDNAPRQADTVMGLSLAHLKALVAGTPGPTMAYIAGSMSVALKIGQPLEE